MRDMVRERKRETERGEFLERERGKQETKILRSIFLLTFFMIFIGKKEGQHLIHSFLLRGGG